MNRLLDEIAKARRYLELTEPEDDGLTEFPMAASKDNLCYLDAESAIIILDWIESFLEVDK